MKIHMLLALFAASWCFAEDGFYWLGKIGKSDVQFFQAGAFEHNGNTGATRAEKDFFQKHQTSQKGYYFYEKYRNTIAWVGKITDSAWDIEEHVGSICINCKPNGYIQGIPTGDTVTGFWYSADKSKKQPFRIVKFPITKKDIFQQLSGHRYELQSAEGFYGANTMTGLSREAKGRWSAGGSAISAGMREAFDSDLSKSEVKILNQLQLSITKDLEILIQIDTLKLLRLPFTNEPYFHLEHITAETDGIGRIHEYQKKPSFQAYSYNIATTDIGLFDEHFQIEALPFDIPSAAHIEYNLVSDLFTITLVSADCCASQELYFSRKK